MNPDCPYCGNQSEKVKARNVLSSTMKGYLYVCGPCDAWVSTNHGWRARLANAQDRLMRQAAHREFDPIWKNGHMRRGAAYRWLARQLDIPKDECHMGMFDAATCKRVIDVARKFRGLSKPNLLQRIRKKQEAHA